jgi:hypothetical protein
VRELSQPHLICCQQDTPSAAVAPGAVGLHVAGAVYGPVPPGASIRRTLRGLMPDGSTRTLLAHNWPEDGTEVTAPVTGPMPLRVWVHTDASAPLAVGETIDP